MPVGFFPQDAYDELSSMVKKQLRELIRSRIYVVHSSLLASPGIAHLVEPIWHGLEQMSADPANAELLTALGAPPRLGASGAGGHRVHDRPHGCTGPGGIPEPVATNSNTAEKPTYSASAPQGPGRCAFAVLLFPTSAVSYGRFSGWAALNRPVCLFRSNPG